MTTRLFLIIFSVLNIGCFSQHKISKNEDLEVRLNNQKGKLSLTIKNIGSSKIAVGVNDSIVWNDTILEIQVGEYSYLQTFMTDFQLLDKGQSFEKKIDDSVNSDNYLIKLIYTPFNDQISRESFFKESTTFLYPDGKFFILKIDGPKVTSGTKSIY